MKATDRAAFVSTGMASAQACIPLMTQDNLEAGMTQAVPAVRDFWNLAGDTLVNQESRVVGMDNMKLALEHMGRGGNVLMVQNHRSGADTMVFETLVRRALGRDVCKDWAYMSGHAVNLYLIPLMFCGGMNRFQIFSAKYLSAGLNGVDEVAMNAQNQRAMMSLRRHVKGGGRLVGFYPEGGRGDGCMKLGEPKTSCIPKIMASASKAELLVLPTYVCDASNILNPVRGINEYNEIFVNSRPGTASLVIGEPVPWGDICVLNCEHETVRGAWNVHVNNTLLALVARLGPPEERGPHDPSIVEELCGSMKLERRMEGAA